MYYYCCPALRECGIAPTPSMCSWKGAEAAFVERGYGDGRYLSSVERCDVISDTWIAVAPMQNKFGADLVCFWELFIS